MVRDDRPMASLRRWTPVVVLLVAPLLGACGDDGEDGDGDDRSPATESTSEDTSSPAPPTSEATSTTTEAAGLPDTCDVVSQEDVSVAFGVEFGAPVIVGSGRSEGDLAWKADSCEWTAEDLVEVQVGLTGPDDFTQGEFTCPEPIEIVSTVEPVPGLGDAAWWKLDEAPPLEATLRVCTASYFFDVDVEFEDGVDFQGDPKAQSIALAGVVIAKLG